MASTPNWTAWLASQWGPSSDDGIFLPAAVIAAASNVVVGTNPPYTIQDLYSNYPTVGGTPLAIPNVTVALGSTTAIAGAPWSGSIPSGTPVAGTGIPDGTFVVTTNGNNIQLSNPALANGSIILTVWNNPTIPTIVTQLYIALATASLSQQRWQEQWVVAMGWFVMHYLTLYARAAGNPNSTIGQIAAQGLAFGIQTSKSVGDVSVGYTALLMEELAQFGAWNLTLYGQLLATAALAVGAGPMLLY